ncbi:Rab geranylgeranyltransferase [Friedmanniomyces endolithicus]|uniref:Geranylgeranyl transferase type-2 subunit alpha n=1 Tax=Friedmanniomyces endolithicus TaxID=329885 RepID=A0AAN6FJS2_9PEZI|nr:Rab geranylgeranyltransferase [Friedmanniomyces endolithicus]
MQSHGIPRVAATTLDKSEQARNKERKQIIQYQALERDVVDRAKAKDYSDTTFQLTSQLLTQNPEYYTIWNYRRLILQHVFARELAADEKPSEQDSAAAEKANLPPAQHEVLLLIKEDLQFLIPLLKQYPKCYWIWNHRSWLLGTATKHLPAHSAVTLWQAELGLVSKMLGLDSRNFHGWGYRREVVLAIERLNSNGDGEKGSGTGNMVESEFAYTTKMIQSNLSNFSAWHYRSQLIPASSPPAKPTPTPAGNFWTRSSNSSPERCTRTPTTRASGFTTSTSWPHSTLRMRRRCLYWILVGGRSMRGIWSGRLGV